MARRDDPGRRKAAGRVEVMPYSGGLNRNIVQCLHDYDIPLYLSHTVTDIRGVDRVEQVVVSQVNDRRQPIPGTEMVFDCDTLLLSVGLIPENELTRQAGIVIDPRTNGTVVWENMETSLPGVFASGNVAHVHDLVDFVTAESQRAGKAAARYVLEGEAEPDSALEIVNGTGYPIPSPSTSGPGRGGKRPATCFSGKPGVRAPAASGSPPTAADRRLFQGLSGSRRNGAHPAAPQAVGRGQRHPDRIH